MHTRKKGESDPSNSSVGSFKWFKMQKTAMFWTAVSAYIQLEGLQTPVVFRAKLLSGFCYLNIGHLIESTVVTFSDPMSVSYQNHLARKIH